MDLLLFEWAEVCISGSMAGALIGITSLPFRFWAADVKMSDILKTLAVSMPIGYFGVFAVVCVLQPNASDDALCSQIVSSDNVALSQINVKGNKMEITDTDGSILFQQATRRQAIKAYQKRIHEGTDEEATRRNKRILELLGE